MVAGGRTPFTPEDDALLVKYIAKYNPGVQGRSGNRIYKQLIENAYNKWKWGQRHPWQGWRDRYYKNQPEFNRRIKRYQTEKGMPTENSIWVNGTQKDKDKDASADEDDTKRKRKRMPTEDAPVKGKRIKIEQPSKQEMEESGDDTDDDPHRPRAHAPDIYPDISGLSSHSKAAPQPKTQRVPPLSKPRARPVRKDTDSDFFASIPPTPTTDATHPPTTASGGSVSNAEHQPISKARALARLVEGPYRTTFPGAQRAPHKSDDEQAPQWPPLRKRQNVVNSTAATHGSLGGGSEPLVPRASPPRQVNAVASSSRVQLSPRPTAPLRVSPQVLPPRRSPTRTPPRAPADVRSPSPLDWGSPLEPSTSRISSPLKARRLLPSLSFDNKGAPTVNGSPLKGQTQSGPRPFFGRRVGHNPQASPPRPNGSSPTNHNRNRDSNGGATGDRNTRHPPTESPPHTETRHVYYRLPRPPPVSSSRTDSGNGTPLAQKGRTKAVQAMSLLGVAAGRNPARPSDNDPRRHSFPASAMPRVDFEKMSMTVPRQSLPPRSSPRHKAPPRRHGSLFSPRALPSPASSSGGPAMSVSDQALLVRLGLEKAISIMAGNHNFGTEVVWSVYSRVDDLAKTDAILLRMRTTAEAEGQAALNELGSDDEWEGQQQQEEALTLRHRRRTSSLKRTPQSGESERFQPRMLERAMLGETEYTPPSESRAGGITRLVKKGRTEEALLRERKRASGGGTLSSFSRDMRMQTQGRAPPDMEDDVPRTPPFAAFAEANVEVLRELEERDVSLGMLRAAEVATYMIDGTVPPELPHR
ncbi:hypothetical protein C8J57DRAFT_681881 [Mycena rebaudengoi]|nr:hypothetical protein C8J57DRAFT_681881 [Mycena rebaudengoi]